MYSKKLLSNFIWRLLERFGAQGVTFVVSIVLARLLDPSVYGTVALVTVFITILQVFVVSGLGNALIQKRNSDDLDFSSVFYFNIVICIILYVILFVIAGLIANFYGNTELIPIIRVLGINIIISGIKNIQQAYVSKKLIFKKFFFSTLGGTVGAAIVGILMAYHGYGVWALVAQTLFNSLVDTIILWFTVGWRPKLMFSFKRLMGLLSYGWKLLVSSLIDTGYNKLRELLIGKIYSAQDLAYYNRGNQLPSNLVISINTAIDSVLLPTMAEQQDELNKIKAMTRKAIKMSAYCIMPMMVGVSVCAKPIVSLLLTEKWIGCVPYLQIFCFTYAMYPIHTANLNALKAIGRSDLFLKLEIIKKIVGLLLLFSTINLGALAMAFSCLLAGFISQIINAWPNKKLLNYGFIEQMKDILPSISLSVIMGIFAYGVYAFNLSNIVTLIIQVIIGSSVYFLGSWILHFESFEYVRNIIRKSKKGE